MTVAGFQLPPCFRYPSHKESARPLFISACLFILGNDLIRGFLVEHGALWLNGFMWSQSTQVCTAGCHFRSLNENPCGAPGGKTIDCCSASPIFFPSCKIIHFNRPTPLSLSRELAIKRLTSLHERERRVWNANKQTPGILKVEYIVTWVAVAVFSHNLLHQYVNVDGCKQW